MGAPTIWTVLACTMLHACSAFTAALGPLAASAPGPLAASAPRHSAPKCTNVPGGPGLHSRRAVLLAAAAAAGVSPAHAEDMANRAALLDSSEDHNANGAPDKHTPTVKLVSSGGSSGEVVVTIPHVMDSAKPHFIELVWLKETGSMGEAKKIVAAKGYTLNNLISNPSLAASPPGLKARVKKGTRVTPMLYCNLHGVWEGEPILV